MSKLKNLRKSDHCNGEFFFNPGFSNYNKTFADILKWQFSNNRKKWPHFIPNRHVPNLQTPTLPGGCNLSFVNHATVLVQTRHCTFMTDPVWADRTSPFQWLGPRRARPAGLELSDLPKLDFILLSHNHYDHMDETTLRYLANQFNPAIFIPLGLEGPLRDWGFTKIIEMDWWESAEFMDAHVTFLPALHWSGRWFNDRNRSLWGSFMVRTDGRTIYFAGDSGYGKHFTEIRERMGAPSLSLLPIGAYEPRWFMKLSHMNPAEAVQAHVDLGSKQSMGIHFGTWQLTDEGIDEPLIELEKAIGDRQLHSPFFVLQNGESKLVSLELAQSSVAPQHHP